MDSFDIFKKLSVGAKFKKPEKSSLTVEVIHKTMKHNVFVKVVGSCFFVVFSLIKNDKPSTKQIKVKTVGDRVPEALSTFDAMKSAYSLNPVLMENLNKSGYTVPTPIQTQAIPIMLQVCR